MNGRKRHGHRLCGSILAATLLLAALAPPWYVTAAVGFAPDPKTAYAAGFIEKCDGQQWFMDEVERLLNVEQKSINTLQSAADLKNIVTLAHSGGAASVPPAIGELAQLREIFLHSNKLIEIQPAIYTLPELEVIDMSGNALSGSIPAGINYANFPKLKVLLLWDNTLSGEIPDALYEFTELENLDVSYNRLEGVISPGVGALTKLKMYGASNNALTGEIPAQFGNCAALKALVLWNNNLTGGIPDAFGALTELEILDVAMNGLTGELPQDMPVSLRKFAARSNGLTGGIPAAYSALTELDTLDLYDNELTGAIPPGLASLTKMERLDISSNALGGTIPDIFANMTKLEIAYLSGNMLTGKPPQSLVDRQAGGAEVNISQNYLTGETAKQITYNTGNFIDGAPTMQNRMYMSGYAIIAKDAERNIYSLFEHRRAPGTAQPTGKAKLPADGYALGLDMTADEQAALLDYYGAASIDEIYTARHDGSGWHIALHKEIKLACPIKFSLMILNNDGSEYSRTLFKVTSEAPAEAAGGGGGAGTEPTPTPTPGEETGPAPEETPKAGFISGYPDKTVRPDGALTREEAAQILYNILGTADTVPYNGRYTDMDGERWSAKAVEYLSELGHITGYPDGSFRPAGQITRAEFVALLCRFLGIPAAEGEAGFGDTAGHWARGYIASATEKGYVTGYPGGTFKPNNGITRAEAVVILCRVYRRVPDRGKLTTNPFADLDPTHWAYWEILEAADDRGGREA
jgi:Leucine-rich repeat (LRR) protein